MVYLLADHLLSFLTGLIKQFLCDVDWGDVDYLLIDTPPGTSDEHLSVVQYLKSCGIDGAILVTTPQVGYLDFTSVSKEKLANVASFQCNKWTGR